MAVLCSLLFCGCALFIIIPFIAIVIVLKIEVGMEQGQTEGYGLSFSCVNFGVCCFYIISRSSLWIVLISF